MNDPSMVERVWQFLHSAVFGNLYRYLYPGEHQIYSERRHVIVVVPWLMAMVGGLAGAVIAIYLIGQSSLQAVAVLGSLLLTIIATYHFLEWLTYRVFISDRRLVEMKGFIGVQVNMMPLNKITDMVFDHTVPGITLGYGNFRIETAGQDQALAQLRFIVNEELFYMVSTALALDRASGLNNLAEGGYFNGGTVVELVADGLLSEETVRTMVDDGVLGERDLKRLLVEDALETDDLHRVLAEGKLSQDGLFDAIIDRVRDPARSPLDIHVLAGLIDAGLVEKATLERLISAGVLTDDRAGSAS